MCIFHKQRIKFINKSKRIFIDDYLKKYGKSISKIYSLRDSITIEINDENTADSHIIDCKDKYTPMQTLTKKQADATCLNIENDIILISTNYYEPPLPIESFFSNEELFALLSHEIGHIIASYTNHDYGGTKEEVYADDCASKLGLRNTMLSAVKKMLAQYDNSSERAYDFINAPNRQQRNQFEKRISVLSNP